MERAENVSVDPATDFVAPVDESVADLAADVNEFAAEEPVGESPALQPVSESSAFQPVMDPSLVDPEMAEAAHALVGMPQGGVAVAGMRQNVTTEELDAEGLSLIHI